MSSCEEYRRLSEEERLPFEREEKEDRERDLRECRARFQSRFDQWQEQLKETPLDVRDSHLGGLPYLALGDEWPSAQSMGAEEGNANFLLQLRLSQLPDELGCAHAMPGRPLSDQLIQVFGGEEAPYLGQTLVRLIDCSRPARTDVAAPPDTEVYPCQFITGWNSPVRDFPFHSDWDHPLVRVPVTAPLQKWGEELFGYRWGEHLGRYAPMEDDKVGGWPISSVYGRQACPQCDSEMEQDMSINTGTIGIEMYMMIRGTEMYNCSVPLIISQCAEHKEQLLCQCPVEID